MPQRAIKVAIKQRQAPPSRMSLDTIDRLFEKYGPLVGGEDLVRICGFRSARGLTLSARAGELGFRVFQLPARRGHYALTEDVGRWLLALRDPPSDHVPHAVADRDAGRSSNSITAGRARK